MAAVQTFKKQYSFEAYIAAVADPGEGLGGRAPPYFSTERRPEGPKIIFWRGPSPYLRVS